MKSILVTGSNGQLGSELQLLSNEDSHEIDWIFINRLELDFLDLKAISDRLDFYNPDVIINCAAYTAVDKAESEFKLAEIINHQAVGVIANWTNSNNKKLIHISTDYVFDGKSNIPLTEDSETAPLNVYGKTKLMGEIICIKEDPNSIVIRTSWVYSRFGTNFVKTMLQLMKERDQLKIVDDQFGSPTSAADLANSIISIIFGIKWDPGIYHFSNEGEITWYQFAKDIKELMGLTCQLIPITSTEYTMPTKRPAYSILDKSKIKQHFNVVVSDYKESLRKCLEHIIIDNK